MSLIAHGKRRTDNGKRTLGQLTARRKKFFTEIVENPVEKIGENRIALQQSEEISGLHHRGAVHIGANKPTDYTVTTS